MASENKREVEQQRAAFADGVRFVLDHLNRRPSLYDGFDALRALAYGGVVKIGGAHLSAELKRRYPMPTVKVLREEPDPHNEFVRWRLCERGASSLPGVQILEFQDLRDGLAWRQTQSRFVVSPERVRLWGDLLASPMKEVEA